MTNNNIFKAGHYTLPLGGAAYVMAVINLTPDSFYAGSRCAAENAAKRAAEAVSEGAQIIDLGAQSTAPGSKPITAEEELERLIGPLCEVRKAVDVPISVDTFFQSVAKTALENGADIINDVSGSVSGETAELVKEHGAGWIIMHTGGMTSSMSGSCSDGAVSAVQNFFRDAKEEALRFGVNESQLCFDPGIGFGKTREDDIALIAHFGEICVGGCAMLAALSRKRVTRLCGDELIGTAASNTACILGGADIIRVHDIMEACAVSKMADLLRKASV